MISARNVDVHSNDEVAAMVQDFNVMLDGLQETGAAFSGMNAGLSDLVREVRASALAVARRSAELGSNSNNTGLASTQVAAGVASVAQGFRDHPHQRTHHQRSGQAAQPGDRQHRSGRI